MALIPTLLGFVAAALGPDDFTITIPVSPETPEGQRLLVDRARQICGRRYPLLARYRFSGDEHIDPAGQRESRFEVSQELTCSDTPPVTSAEPPAPADWQPTARDQSDVVALTERYFAATDSGDAAQVHAMWVESEREAVPLETRAAELRRFRAEAGAPGRHRIARLTWYVNPEGAPRPGIYVAVDYDRTYSGLLVNCGYLVWYREAESRYVLGRQENNLVARGDVPDTPEAIAQARSLSRCTTE